MRKTLFGKIASFIFRNLKHVVAWALIIVLGLGVGYFVYDNVFEFLVDDPYAKQVEDGEKIVLDIPKGSSGAEIGELLEAAGLVKSGTLFRYKAQFMGDAEDFQYGTYTFIEGMTYPQIVEVLKTGSKAEGVMITITPGMSVSQVGQMLQDMDICTKEAFEKACKSTEYNFDYYGSIKNPSYRRFLLEGYLCADTIEVIPAEGVEAIVARLLRHTELLIEENDWVAKAKKLGMTIDDVMTMASVVEKEALGTAEMKKIARVFYNRNNNNMAWESDPTVWYALGMEDEAHLELTYDLIYQASYPANKYYRYTTYYGLGNQDRNPDGYWLKPVGPICNPSKAAIEAVLNPTKGSWLYFYGDGTKTYFFTSYEEFLAKSGS